MIKKTENCLYCGEKMESKTAKKKFCCPLHRVYWNREKEKGTLGLEIKIKNGEADFVKYDMESVLPAISESKDKEMDLKPPKHPLWKEGDPKEGSMAFYLKYDCYTYSELENKEK